MQVSARSIHKFLKASLPADCNNHSRVEKFLHASRFLNFAIVNKLVEHFGRFIGRSVEPASGDSLFNHLAVVNLVGNKNGLSDPYRLRFCAPRCLFDLGVHIALHYSLNSFLELSEKGSTVTCTFDWLKELYDLVARISTTAEKADNSVIRIKLEGMGGLKKPGCGNANSLFDWCSECCLELIVVEEPKAGIRFSLIVRFFHCRREGLVVY